MKKYLIMVKHSLPEIVENLPAREWRLSNEGRIRAEKLADRLRGYHPEIIASSVEPKAMETAEIIAGKHGLAVHVFEGLHEHERDTVPFLSRDQFESAVLEFLKSRTKSFLGVSRQINPASVLNGQLTQFWKRMGIRRWSLSRTARSFRCLYRI
jgi:broad specificity phosphatase PhoE